jgi:hypothetical protein
MGENLAIIREYRIAHIILIRKPKWREKNIVVKKIYRGPSGRKFSKHKKKNRSAHNIFIGKPKGKRPLAKPRIRWRIVSRLILQH